MAISLPWTESRLPSTGQFEYCFCDGITVGGLTGVSALVRRLERHRRRPNVGDAFLGVDRHALGAIHRLLGRSRQLRLTADDAAVLSAAAAAAATAAARRHTGVV